MKTSLIIILAIIGILIIGGGAYLLSTQKVPNQNPVTNNPVSTPTTSSQTHSITISGFAFSPSTLTIKKGDTVTWTNQDSTPHTIVSDSGNEISSVSLLKGNTYSHTFNSAGTFDYHCSIHPSMKAKIIVE
jgi:amicyanin